MINPVRIPGVTVLERVSNKMLFGNRPAPMYGKRSIHNCVRRTGHYLPLLIMLTAPLRYIQLPEHFTGKSFEICAKQAGVEVYGAERFAVGNKPAEKAARISVTAPPTIEALEEGLKRLQKLLQQ